MPYTITISATRVRPNFIIDNLLAEDSLTVVLINGGETILAGTTSELTIDSWVMGDAYLDDEGNPQIVSSLIEEVPLKPASLLNDTGRYFTQPKPLYTSILAGSVVVVTAHGISNDITGNQSSAINSVLASNISSIIFFPAGIYLMQNTVFIPKGSIIMGKGWS